MTALLLGLTLIVLLRFLCGKHGVDGTLARLLAWLHTARDTYEFWARQRRELRRFWRHRRAEYEAALVPRPEEVQTVLEIR